MKRNENSLIFEAYGVILKESSFAPLQWETYNEDEIKIYQTRDPITDIPYEFEEDITTGQCYSGELLGTTGDREESTEFNNTEEAKMHFEQVRKDIIQNALKITSRLK